jgi:DNA-binding XRE family transcriptional regulator
MTARLSEILTDCKSISRLNDRKNDITVRTHQGHKARMSKTRSELHHAEIAKRLQAVRLELGLSKRALADRLGISRTRYLHWETSAKSANFPAEESMIELCEMLPGLTMDFIYRGVLDAVPHALAIRLSAFMEDIDPDTPA